MANSSSQVSRQTVQSIGRPCGLACTPQRELQQDPQHVEGVQLLHLKAGRGLSLCPVIGHVGQGPVVQL